MNIAIFTDTYFPDINGVASSVYTLSTELKKRGHNVYIFTVTDPASPLAKDEEEELSAVYRFPSMPIFFLKPKRAASPFSIRVLRLIRKFKIDVIHTQTEFFMGYMARGVAAPFRIPLVHTFHTMYEDYLYYIAKGKLITPPMARQYTRAFCNAASAVIAPTEKTADFLNRCGVSKPIYIIPTGIDFTPLARERHTDEETIALKKKHQLDPSWPIILVLGRVAKEKSIDMAIGAMPELLKKLPEARLIIIGSGPDRKSLEELSGSLGVQKNVIFFGSVPYPEIGSYYRLADVFLCCSKTETQGLTYYEAMASSVPIVARKDECIRKIIRDRVDGRLFDKAEAIPDILYEVLTDRKTAELYARNAIAAVTSYSSPTFAERVEDVYIHTIERRRIRHEQRIDSMMHIPSRRDLRKLRLVTTKSSNQKRKKKNSRKRRG
jgi:1,2-diacylglycerol 3-alpha-glucosyltransferase